MVVNHKGSALLVKCNRGTILKDYVLNKSHSSRSRAGTFRRSNRQTQVFPRVMPAVSDAHRLGRRRETDSYMLSVVVKSYPNFVDALAPRYALARLSSVHYAGANVNTTVMLFRAQNRTLESTKYYYFGSSAPKEHF